MGANDKPSRKSVQKQRGKRSFRKDTFCTQRRNDNQEPARRCPLCERKECSGCDGFSKYE